MTESSAAAAAAAQLESDHDQMRELAENINEVFWLTDPSNTTMLLISPAYERVFGRRAAVLHGDPGDWLNAVHPDDRARIAAFRAAPTVSERRAQFRVVHSGGAIRTIQLKVFPIRDPNATVIRIAGAAEDITERLALEEQIRQTQKMESLGLLAGGVAHDFNNVLSVISSNATMLDEVMPVGHPDHELVDEIVGAVRRAAALTHQLLAFSRRQVVAPIVVDVNAAINDTRKMLRRMVGEDIVITTSLEPELHRVRIDPGYFTQVLMNLAVNARDAMPRGGAFTIESRNVEARREVMLSLTDTGCGIPDDVKARVFEPFFTTKGEGRGTGLGLSVVHGIVEQAGGRLEVDSEVGVGTTFRVFLPFSDAPSEASAATPTPRTRGTETVILVDDDPHVRRSIARGLRMHGYEVLEARDGRAALELLGSHAIGISLLVTDVVMPGMDGRELVEMARQRRPSLPVLYISGYTDDAVQHHGVERAHVSVLEKPFRSAALAERVRQLLDA